MQVTRGGWVLALVLGSVVDTDGDGRGDACEGCG
jgi:hypothetical protein